MSPDTILTLCPPADGALNFALDELLMRRAQAVQIRLIRVYSWSLPVVSFGRNERARATYDPDRLTAARIDVVRRPTGGRALLHHHEWTYAAAGPTRPGETLHSVYADVHALIASALHRLGVAVEPASSSRTHAATEAMRTGRTANAPCFAWPTTGELVVNGRKLVASAQWRTADTYLQHGSILLDDDQLRLRDVAIDPTAWGNLPAPATLRELMHPIPSITAFADALASAVAEHGGHPARWQSPLELFPEREVAPLAARYRDPGWTWRR
jgi:lipoate-protein ligase A